MDVGQGLADTLTVLRAKVKAKSAAVTVVVGARAASRCHGLRGRAEPGVAEPDRQRAGRRGVGRPRGSERGARKAGSSSCGSPTTGRHPAAALPRIFDPFFTTKPVGQGTGLGLDIVRRLVNRHDGQIDVESRPGRTVFTVSLPRCRPVAPFGMPRQNRVTPFGELISTLSARNLMGNRGCLHDDRRPSGRLSPGRRWITCVLEFRRAAPRDHEPGRYTELFFLDEATAMAAGHRPCAECQRARYRLFRETWAAANAGLVATPSLSADEIDRVLHAERLDDGRRKRRTSPGCPNCRPASWSSPKMDSRFSCARSVCEAGGLVVTVRVSRSRAAYSFRC